MGLLLLPVRIRTLAELNGTRLPGPCPRGESHGFRRASPAAAAESLRITSPEEPLEQPWPALRSPMSGNSPERRPPLEEPLRAPSHLAKTESASERPAGLYLRQLAAMDESRRGGTPTPRPRVDHLPAAAGS